ncbi:MAG: TIGR00269 family protein [Candidatus Woesearchaeota archaeon]|jgi:uncharacterized protein (TIGR00269 family)|nr:TIGR00269 family protein [Candidatus Woesearchaeota archaeon]
MEKDFIKNFEKKLKKTIKDHNLIKKSDKVIVACSGGKDSTVLLYLLNKLGYKVVGLIIDLLVGTWSKKNLNNIQEFCKSNKIKLHVINIRDEIGSSICYVRSGIQSKVNLGNCTICGVIKRWLLNNKPRELKADKIATGHNLDDAAETVLMNYMKGNPELSIGLGPRTGVIKSKKFVQRIKPLYFFSNKEIKKYSQLHNFPVLYDPCPCSIGVFRRNIRELLNLQEKKYPDIKLNIVNNFLEFLPKLKKKFISNKELNYCKLCGEPSRKEVCRKCSLIKILKS